jgi:hypothetical protein
MQAGRRGPLRGDTSRDEVAGEVVLAPRVAADATIPDPAAGAPERSRWHLAELGLVDVQAAEVIEYTNAQVGAVALSPG